MFYGWKPTSLAAGDVRNWVDALVSVTSAAMVVRVQVSPSAIFHSSSKVGLLFLPGVGSPCTLNQYFR